MVTSKEDYIMIHSREDCIAILSIENCIVILVIKDYIVICSTDMIGVTKGCIMIIFPSAEDCIQISRTHCDSVYKGLHCDPTCRRLHGDCFYTRLCCASCRKNYIAISFTENCTAIPPAEHGIVTPCATDFIVVLFA